MAAALAAVSAVTVHSVMLAAHSFWKRSSGSVTGANIWPAGPS